MVNNPYITMIKNELEAVYRDIVISKELSQRAESLVPYAAAIKENIGESFPLAEGINMAKKDFFDEVAKRYFDEEPWIPVKAGLPDMDEDGVAHVLVSFDDGFVATVDFVNGEWELWADSGEPVAWMPLPKAYVLKECASCRWFSALENSEGKTVTLCLSAESPDYMRQVGYCGHCKAYEKGVKNEY